jgi:hypothetical protein
MLPKARRPREKRIAPLERVTYSIAEYCEMSGLSKAMVLSFIDDGTLRIVRLGQRRLILARQPRGNGEVRSSVT